MWNLRRVRMAIKRMNNEIKGADSEGLSKRILSNNLPDKKGGRDPIVNPVRQKSLSHPIW